MATNISNISTVTTSEPKTTGSCSFKFTEAELPLILFISTISNLVAVVTLTKLYRKMRSKNVYLMTILAANDVCSSLSILINNIVNTITCDSFSRYPLCDFLGWIGIGSFGWSMFIVATISVERYLMVVHPFVHHTRVTKVKLGISVTIGAAVSLLFTFLPLVGVGSPYIYYKDNRFCGFNWAASVEGIPVHTFFVEFLAMYGLFQVAVTFFCNICCMLHMRCRKNRVRPVVLPTDNQIQRQTSRFALLTVVIVTVNSICNGPFFIKLIIDGITQKQRIEGIEDSVTSILLFCTPVINPILHLIFNKSYRGLLCQRTLCCKAKPVPQQRNPNIGQRASKKGSSQEHASTHM